MWPIFCWDDYLEIFNDWHWLFFLTNAKVQEEQQNVFLGLHWACILLRLRVINRKYCVWSSKKFYLNRNLLNLHFPISTQWSDPEKSSEQQALGHKRQMNQIIERSMSMMLLVRWLGTCCECPVCFLYEKGANGVSFLFAGKVGREEWSFVINKRKTPKRIFTQLSRKQQKIR